MYCVEYHVTYVFNTKLVQALHLHKKNELSQLTTLPNKI